MTTGAEGGTAVKSQEIAILNDLVRATCHSTDRCAAAARACEDGYRKMVIEQLCEDRRLLLVDLIRCLLLRGVPVPEVRKAITAAPSAAIPVIDVDVIWIDVEIAEKRLHQALRGALEDPKLSDSVRELLSLHWLRIRLHHDALDGLAAQRSSLEEKTPVARRTAHH
jgi:hypothetical protein